MNDKKKKRETPPGEGERRSMRGYVPQYDFAAGVIYQSIASGRLRWVGLADRAAGNFDDVVLGLNDRVIGHQVKTSAAAKKINLRTLLLGGPGLLAALTSVWKKLKADSGIVEVRYVCDDYPAADDNLVAPSTPALSSAAFLRALDANRTTYRLQDWMASPFAGFVKELQQGSGLEAAEFEAFLGSVFFVPSGEGRTRDDRALSAHDTRRISDIAALLPRLVANNADKDRWTLDELLNELHWKDPFGPRHGHVFPLDALVQSNPATQEKLQAALAHVESGYVALVGPPGCGKSTLLQSGLLPTPRAVVLRYLAFMPNEGHGLGRGEAVDFLHDLVAQLKRQGLGIKITPGRTEEELRQQFEELLREAGQTYEKDGIRTLIVVDGLDHVPREERPSRSFLSTLPLPTSVPKGVLFVLGTQRLELEGLPPGVRDQAREDARCVPVTALSREAVYRLAELSNLPDDCDRDLIYERSQGHPLSVRYIIEGLQAGRSEEERKAWLHDGPAYGGDVEVFYTRAWHDLEAHESAKEVLSFVALAEGNVHRSALDRLVDSNSVDKAWNAARHLLRRSRNEGWQVFHNSFRLYLLQKTSTRHGLPAPEIVKERYLKLAELARTAGGDDEQRWMELRYKARAGDHKAVLDLSEPQRFRAQFIDGRNPRAILDDIKLAFAAVAVVRSPSRLLELILARHEIEMRTEALGVDELVDAYLAVGELDQAIGLIDTDGNYLPRDCAYRVMDALLDADRTDDARRIFDEHEPLEKLLGSKPVEGHSTDDELFDWAKWAPVFRAPEDILVSIERLRDSERPFPGEFDIETYKGQLRFAAARWVLERNPTLEPKPIGELYKVSAAHHPYLLFVAARSAHFNDMPELAIQRLKNLGSERESLDDDARRDAALLCLRHGLAEHAANFFETVGRPELEKDYSGSRQRVERRCREIFDHATLEAALGQARSESSNEDVDLLQGLQRRIEELGALYGLALSGKHLLTDGVLQPVKKILTFLDRARSKAEGYDSDRWWIDRPLPFLARAIVRTAAAHGKNVLDRIAEHIDEVLNTSAMHLREPSFRRAFAVETYRRQLDRGLGLKRLIWDGSLGGERTPQEHIQQASEEAIGLVHLGEPERARQLLRSIHDEGLGYSRAPKKDPQFEMWRELFEKACREDPAGIPERVAFMVQLLDGLSNTEGSSAGARITAAVIKAAATGGAGVARDVIDRLEETGLTSWAELVSNLMMGLVRRSPNLASEATIAFGRLALPFLTDVNENAMEDLVKFAPAGQLEFIAKHGVKCAETDAHVNLRYDILESIRRSAEARGPRMDMEVLDRWRAERIVKTEGSSEYEQLNDVGSIKELTKRLGAGSSKISSWEIARALARIEPTVRFADLKAFLDAHPHLLEEEKIVSLAASAALKDGAIDAARTWVAELKRRAATEASWGGYQSGAKQRLYTLLTAIDGDTAREQAFTELALDLSRGKEWTLSLLPDLGEVLELTKPRLSFAEVWTRLAEHLHEFRDFKAGRPTPVCSNSNGADHELIAELYKRAFGFGAAALETLARIGLRETAELPQGPVITIAVINALWADGGDHALVALRIAWECRHISAVKAEIGPKLPEWARSRDLAVQRIAAVLASHWQVELPDTRQPLPAFYSIEMPDDAMGEKFEEPFGYSDADEGLWTDDPYTWTWGLKRPLKTLSRAAGYSVETLRRRAAQLMAQQGGRSAFGPEVAKKRKQRMSRLELLMMYHRPMAFAAMRAAREVGGELAQAGKLDSNRRYYFLREAGGINLTTDTAVPAPRPVGVARPQMPDLFGASLEDWRNKARNTDLARDRFAGWVCVASASRYEKRRFNETTSVERTMLPEIAGSAAADLDEAWGQLASVIVIGSSLPTYDGLAQGAVVTIMGDAAGSFPELGLTLCPCTAEQLGIRADEMNPFVFRDAAGIIVVRTLWWREGGFHSKDVDDAERGEGCILLVAPTLLEKLRTFIGSSVRVSAWRKFSRKRDDTSAPSADHRSYSLD